MGAATQQDIDRLRDDMGKTWADVRDSIHRHEDSDAERFNAMTNEIHAVQTTFAEWSGALSISKWALGLGIPTIIGLIATHLIRHWN